jgi:hypothetical protein
MQQKWVDPLSNQPRRIGNLKHILKKKKRTDMEYMNFEAKM